MTAPGPPGDQVGSLADDLLRVAAEAGAGSLPRRGLRARAGAARRLDVTLRAALFCELAQAGIVTGVATPEVPAAGVSADPMSADPMSPNLISQDPMSPNLITQDPILAAVAAAVARRPGVPWLRWFSHLSQDRAVLVDRLVQSGRWTPAGARFTDADPDGAARLLARTLTVSELISAPADARETVLGYLFALTGPAIPADRALGWDVRLATLDGIGTGTGNGATTRAILTAARQAVRPGLRRRSGRVARAGRTGR